jgi:glycosyltransferase involved in cell wall biosynthesis
MSNQSIHIGIDGNEANVNQRVGSNRFAYHLLSAIHKLNQIHRITVYLKTDPVADMPHQNKLWTYKVITPSSHWTQFRLPLELYLNHKERPNVFFTPGHYRPRFSPIKTAITILDLAFLHYPNLFLTHKRGVAQLTNWTKYSVQKSDHLFAISQHTKNDLIESYRLDKNKVTVSYPGIDMSYFSRPPASTIQSVLKKYQLPEKYILYLGTIQPRKNLQRLVEAFNQLPRTYAEFHLVIGGQIGWKYQDLINAINHSTKKTSIHQLGFVDNPDLPALYSQAATLCLIGLHEGFGIPPAEAIACGTIPIISNAGALPEVVGPNAITVDPFSVQSIKQGIMKVLDATPRQKAILLNRYQKHIRQFTWEQSAQTVVKVLYELALKR